MNEAIASESPPSVRRAANHIVAAAHWGLRLESHGLRRRPIGKRKIAVQRQFPHPRWQLTAAAHRQARAGAHAILIGSRPLMLPGHKGFHRCLRQSSILARICQPDLWSTALSTVANSKSLFCNARSCVVLLRPDCARMETPLSQPISHFSRSTATIVCPPPIRGR